jgi:2-haloacid dehalogenase
MILLDQYEVLVFDCYGTLIDWENGILSALRPLLKRHGVSLSDEEILALYAQFEPAAQGGDFVRYKEVLQRVVAAYAKQFSFTPSEADLRCLENSLSEWRPFPDTVNALKVLASHYQLTILSNIDDDLLEHSLKQLVVPFDRVFTAERIGSYKPSLANFKTVLDNLGIPSNRVLHVAQSLYHDIIPAKSLGLSTVWVNRRNSTPGSGATPPAHEKPDLEVPDLDSLASMILEKV